VDATLLAQIREIESANNVGHNRRSLVVLASIYVGTASNTSSIENVRGLYLVELCCQELPILHPRFRKE
jgi:hypothetical protein